MKMQQEPVVIEDVVKVIETKFKKLGTQFRQCGCTPKRLFYVRHGKLRVIRKETVDRLQLNDCHAMNVQDICTQPDFQPQWNPDVFAVADTSGGIHIYKMMLSESVNYEVIATAKADSSDKEFFFYKIEWLDPSTLIALGVDGTLWQILTDALHNEFKVLNNGTVDSSSNLAPQTVMLGKSNECAQLLLDRGSMQQSIGTDFDTCHQDASGHRLIAVANIPNKADILLLPCSNQQASRWSFTPDGTPVIGCRWMGSEFRNDLYDILATVTNNGDRLMFWKVGQHGQQPKMLFKVDISSTAEEKRVPEGYQVKWLLVAEGDTVVLTAMGRKRFIMAQITHDRGQYKLSVDDRGFDGFKEADEHDKNKQEEVLISIISPSYSRSKAEREGPELCWMTTHQFSTCRLRPGGTGSPTQDPPIAAASSTTSAPQPPALPQPQSQQEDPPSSAVTSGTHEVMGQRSRRRSRSPVSRAQDDADKDKPTDSTTQPPTDKKEADGALNGKATVQPVQVKKTVVKPIVPLEPLSAIDVAPLPPPPANVDNDMCNSLYQLQNTLLQLQATMQQTHAASEKRIHNLHAEMYNNNVKLQSNHDSTMQLIAQQASDLQNTSLDYFTKMQLKLQSVQTKMSEDITALGLLMKSPAEKMLQDAEKANAASLLNIKNGLESFGGEVFELLSEDLVQHLKKSKAKGNDIRAAFSAELKFQLGSMLEKRLPEICDFQTMMLLDYESVCKEVAANLEAEFIKTRESASVEVGRQLGEHQKERCELLAQLGTSLHNKFESIQYEIRSLATAHDRSRESITDRVEQFLQSQSAAPVAGGSVAPAADPSSGQYSTYAHELEIKMSGLDYEAGIDIVNAASERDTLMPQFRKKYESQMAQICSNVSMPYKMVLLRDVLVSARDASPGTTSNWIMSILSNINRGEITGSQTEQLFGLLDWGAKTLASFDMASSMALSNYRGSFR